MALKVNAKANIRQIADKIKESSGDLPEKGGNVRIGQDVLVATLPEDVTHDQFTKSLNHVTDLAVATEIAAAELAAEKGNLKGQDDDYKLVLSLKLSDDVTVKGQVKKREEVSGGINRETNEPNPRQVRHMSTRSSVEMRTTKEHDSYRQEIQDFAKGFLANI